MFGLRRIWAILEPLTLNVDAAPAACIEMLQTATRPSTDRLHLREAFVEGRRYFIRPTRDGFQMATTSKTLLNRRRRTEALCILNARAVDTGDGRTSLAFSAHMRPVAFIYTLWVPAAMVWLLWPVPWPRPLIVLLLGLLFAFGWTSLRYGAALEATEMVYFIQKTFEDVPKFSLGQLPTPTDTIVGGSEFDAMWDQFVRARQGDT